MKIGQFLVQKNYLSQELIDKALEKQEKDKNLRLGEILIDMNVVTKENLSDYITEFLFINKELDRSDAFEWLNQEEVDKLFSQYIQREQTK